MVYLDPKSTLGKINHSQNGLNIGPNGYYSTYVWGSGRGLRLWSSGFGVRGLRFRVSVLGCSVQSSGQTLNPKPQGHRRDAHQTHRLRCSEHEASGPSAL